MNTIFVTIRTTYGVQRIHPHCDKAKLFCRLLNQTTLTREDVDTIKLLGYTVEVVTELPRQL